MDNKTTRNGAIIGIVALLLLGLVYAFFASNPCKLQDEAPRFNPSKDIKNLKTSDFKTMANFLGYLMYKSDKSNSTSYLRLELKSIEVIGSMDGPVKDPYKLKLTTSCCELILLRMATYDNLVQFHINVENITSNGDTTECSTAGRLISVNLNEYYSCKKPKTFGCYSKGHGNSLIAELHMEQLEFEFDGDANLIKKNQFSKKMRQCD